MMAQPRFSLSWSSHSKNVCSGLSTFQQNEEFVDMTLAADGHFVKVHQLIMSLASPYIKDLIKTAQCQNPVIFLNKVTYPTLCLLLEYIYTGEVLVTQENLEQLMEAGTALHIKGLEDIGTQNRLKLSKCTEATKSTHMESQENLNTDEDKKWDSINIDDEEIDHEEITSNNEALNEIEYFDVDKDDTVVDTANISNSTYLDCPEKDLSDTTIQNPPTKQSLKNPTILFTVSNQGNLQMILNRFLYYLRYSGKKYKVGRRNWRCVEYINTRCPAAVITKGNIVVSRSSAHTHPFHDKKIAKKVREGAVFSAISQAEEQSESLRQKKVESNRGVEMS